MKKESKTAIYDDDLHVEAYHFEGIMQPFPNHFHEYYVIGFIEAGERYLSCKGQEYTLAKGNIVLFNPGDNHGCVQSDDSTLEYRGLNISKAVMLELVEEISGKQMLPRFSRNVISDKEAAYYLCQLHKMIMSGSSDFGKEESFLLLLSLLLQNMGKPLKILYLNIPRKLKRSAHL